MNVNQDSAELVTFRRFAEVCPIAIEEESIVKRQPPEPDISCQLAGSGETVAFELVQIIDEGWARLTSAQFRDGDSLRTEYDATTGILRRALDDRLANALVYVRFRRELSSRERRAAIPDILRELAKLPAAYVGDWKPDSGTPLFGKVRSIRVSRGDFQGPEFDVEAVSSIGDPTVDRVRAKWQKSYTTRHPIELLAYYELQPLAPEVFWLSRLTSFVEQNWTTAPFRRVWLFDVGARTIAYSAVRPG